MRNLKFTVRYDGTDFKGWQTQPGYRTVQETFEAAVREITSEPIRANASGRTDAGVHALAQVVNFFTGSRLDPATLLKGINAKLPADIRVLDCVPVGQAFCANRDARRKRYRYVINDTRIPDPFLRRLSWQPRHVLDVELMQRAANALLGRHDFHSFETEWPNRMSSYRTIYVSDVTRHEETVRIEIEADGFLYNMMRSIAGTLYLIGRGYWPVEKMAEVIASRDRRVAGATAPPQGLFLLCVSYS